MKLSVGDIKFSESYASANVEVETGTYPFLLLSMCSMHVSVPLVEGKALEQYKEELLARAREQITRMYEEIVCGGSQVLKPFKIEVTSSPRDNLEERVALLEKRLSGKRSVHADGEAVDFYRPDGTLGVRLGNLNQQEKHPENAGALSGIYAIGKKAAEDLLGKSGDEELWDMGFRIEDREGRLVVCDENGESEPTAWHRDKIIERIIRVLRSGDRNMLKRLGRAMGLLQVTANIEATNQLCGSARREHVLMDFDNPPFKKVPDDWISPGVEYLKGRV
ncbi:hypothetical protein V8G39_005224 [Salmonella enterica]|nr:hypothetical protein [Salmonella enterica]EIW3590826.1 hypothetical protein [Salmonella enterica]ELH6533638.1 hypothetical protein [Salmonella enterica]